MDEIYITPDINITSVPLIYGGISNVGIFQDVVMRSITNSNTVSLIFDCYIRKKIVIIRTSLILPALFTYFNLLLNFHDGWLLIRL